MKNLMIWDSSEQYNSYEYDKIILWRHYKKPNDRHNIFSISEILEENPNFYRDLYLEWFYSIAKSPIGHSTLDNFLLFEKFDIWAASRFAENSILENSPHIDNAIRILALVNYLNNYTTSKNYRLSIN